MLAYWRLEKAAQHFRSTGWHLSVIFGIMFTCSMLHHLQPSVCQELMARIRMDNFWLCLDLLLLI